MYPLFNQKSNELTENEMHPSKDVFLERIPDKIYQQMVDQFSSQYHFQNGLENGGRMRLANYYVGVSRDLSDAFIQFIQDIINGIPENKYPELSTPEGFKPHPENLLQTELEGDFSFASFDMAVTEHGLQNIEFQAVATYPISAAKLNQVLFNNLPLDNAFLFPDNPSTNWEDFINIYKDIISANQTEGIVLTDRLLDQQKTNFEFYATQKELGIPIEIVDMKTIFEKEGSLFYSKTLKNEEPVKINRLYNRILLSEALFEDHYPQNEAVWKFRFDKKYHSLKFINHPIKLYEVSKRLSPYVVHPFNPECFELSEVAEDFRSGALKFEDYIWKHKWGAAGQGLILSPTLNSLDSLSNHLADYIAQKKVPFKIFKTDDGQEKIVELRFMTATHKSKMIIVPMARIGHTIKNQNGNTEFRIHFGDNNKEGYGFSPVLIFDKKT